MVEARAAIPPYLYLARFAAARCCTPIPIQLVQPGLGLLQQDAAKGMLQSCCCHRRRCPSLLYWLGMLIVLSAVANCVRGCTFESSVDFAGHDLQPVRSRIASNATDCCRLCRETKGCKFWTLQAPNDCYLKTSDAGRRSYGSATSGGAGTYPPTPPPSPPPPTPPTPALQWVSGLEKLQCSA